MTNNRQSTAPRPQTITDMTYPSRHAMLLEHRNIYMRHIKLIKDTMERNVHNGYWQRSHSFWSQRLATVEDHLLEIESAAS